MKSVHCHTAEEKVPSQHPGPGGLREALHLRATLGVSFRLLGFTADRRSPSRSASDRQQRWLTLSLDHGLCIGC